MNGWRIGAIKVIGAIGSIVALCKLTHKPFVDQFVQHIREVATQRHGERLATLIADLIWRWAGAENDDKAFVHNFYGMVDELSDPAQRGDVAYMVMSSPEFAEWLKAEYNRLRVKLELGEAKTLIDGLYA